jgi:hypothetical protein
MIEGEFYGKRAITEKTIARISLYGLNAVGNLLNESN